MNTWAFLQRMDYMSIEFRMILSAILIIYVGAHASLRRPPSAAPPAITDKTKRGKDGEPIKDDTKKEQFVPGFEATDAIMFPLMAGSVLIGLYYILQWLQDPAILNAILRWYMSFTSIASNGTLIGNAMQVAVGFVFPDQWLDMKGNIWTVDPRRRRAQTQDGDDTIERYTPLAGPASKLPLSSRRSETLFTLRHFLKEDWHMQVNIFGLCKESIDYKLTTLIGFILGVILQAAYLYFGGELMSNVIGLAYCYLALTYMSPTSFRIGSLVLASLFVYDIIMVFYTPFMISVATQIEAPIKLTYRTTTRSSILGLGDIVIPGIFICMALRFDLWLHYLAKQQRVPTQLKKVMKHDIPSDGVKPARIEEFSIDETVHRDVKAPFVDCRGQWGNYFWTTPWRNLFSGGRGSSVKAVADSAFDKTYFHATIVGYLLGMIATIGVLVVFKRGQPALLYLVPATVGSLFLTGLWKRQLYELLEYTENGSLDVKDVVVDQDANGKPISPAPESDQEKDKAEGGDTDHEDHEIVMFSITAPREEEDLCKQD